MTPGAANSVFAFNAPPQMRQVSHSPVAPVSGQDVTITMKVTDPDGVDSVVAAVGIAREGLAFGSIDAQPARVIVLLVIPKAQKLQHIRTLAGIARVLGQRDVQEALLAAGTGEEAWDALRGGERARPG